MKKVFALFSAAVLLMSCTGKQSQESGLVTVKFNHSGCARTEDVKADGSGDNFGNAQPELTLKYTENGLLITRTYATMNCSINQGGITCELTVEDGTIHYKAYETDGKTLRCTCLVNTMTVLVSGLQENTEYVLVYTCDGPYRPITFYYWSGLNRPIDLNQYLIEM